MLLLGALVTFSPLEGMLAGVFLFSFGLGVGILGFTFTRNYKTLEPIRYEGVFGGLILSLGGFTGFYVLLALSFPVFPLAMWIACYVLYWVSMLGITIGYHRHATHAAFKCGKNFTRLLYSSGSTSAQWSIEEWGTNHKIHHVRTEIETEDPHTPRESFLHAHIFWIIHNYVYPARIKEAFSRRFRRDPLIQEQKRYYMLASVSGIVLPPFCFGLWGLLSSGEINPQQGLKYTFSALLLCGFLRMALAYHFTFFVNSWAHKWGPHPYEAKNTGDSRDAWFLAPFTAGETLQNIHHVLESLSCYWIKWNYFDFSGALLVAAERVGRYRWLKWAGLPYELNLINARLRDIIENQSRGISPNPS